MDPAASITNMGSTNFALNLDVSNCDEEVDPDDEKRENELHNMLNVIDDRAILEDEDDDIIDADDTDEDQVSSASELSQQSLQREDYQYYEKESNAFKKYSEFSGEQSFVSETSKQTNGYSIEMFREAQGYKFASISETDNLNSEVNNGKNNYRGEAERCNPADFNLQQKLDTNISPEYNSNDDVLLKLREEFRQLQILHKTQGYELQQVKQNEMEIQHQFSLLQAKKEELVFNLQQSQSMVSAHNLSIAELGEKVSNLESQLSTETKAKESAQDMLKHSEIRVQSLQQELNTVNQSRSLAQLQDHYSRSNEDLKLRHQKECLGLREEIDKWQHKFDVKVNEVNELDKKVTYLEQSLVQNSEKFNKLSESLQKSQQQCQELLQSGASGEVTILRLKLENLEDEKQRLEQDNLSLKERIRSLQSELKFKGDEVKSQDQDSKSSGTDNAGKGSVKSGKDTSAGNLPKELERALKNLRSERSSNLTLKKDLKESSKELLFYQEMVKSLKSQLSDKEATTNDLKEERKSKEAIAKLNFQLRNEMAEMNEKHEAELKEVQANDYNSYENAVKKIKMQISSEAKVELEKKCRNYDSQIDKLQREIQLLNDQLFNAKAQYVSCSDENKSLHFKVDELKQHITKSREEMEKEIRIEYDKKNTELNEYYQKQSKEYLKNQLDKEINKAQEEWANQKMEHIKEFIAKAKQDFSEEFAISLEKEKNDIEKEFLAEKQIICLEYENQIKELKQSFQHDKEKLHLLLNQNSESRSKDLIKKINEQHEQNVKNLMESFQQKTSAWEEESQILKKFISDQDSRHNQEKEKLQNDWEQKKIIHFNEEKDLKKNLNEVNEAKQKISNELKKYQKYVSSIRKQYKELSQKMECKISELENFKAEKEAELNQIKQNHAIELLEIEENHKKAKIIHHTQSYCQTTEQMISTTELVKIQQVFLSCLKQIEDKIKSRLLEHRMQSAERLKKALKNYHNQLVAKVFQDVTNEPLSSPTICISQSSLMPDTNIRNKYTRQFTSKRNTVPIYAKSMEPSSSTVGFLGAGDEPTKQNSHLNKCYDMISTPSSGAGEPKKVDFMPSPSYFNDISFDFMPVPETVSAPSLITNKLSFM